MEHSAGDAGDPIGAPRVSHYSASHHEVVELEDCGDDVWELVNV